MRKMKVSEEGTIAKFDISKNLRIVKKLGEGGTGCTFLLFDESVEQLFAFKKYVPPSEDMRDELYDRFVNEIKLLFHISHPNIVRVYNHYLYPRLKTGYIQMEYIEGKTIDQINPTDYGKSWDDYFMDAINAFCYLQNKGILHRDIRPQNLMIDNEGILKIIDFGFGKHIDKAKDENSVVLNWPASSPPDEILNGGEYNIATEIYYLGNLFKHLLKNNKNFSYDKILNKMNQRSSSLRYNSFEEIKNDILEKAFGEIKFSKTEKTTYLMFAESLIDALVAFTNTPIFNRDIESVQNSLKSIVNSAKLETEIFNTQDIINCFISSGGFRYYKNRRMDSKDLIAFYKLFSSTTAEKRKAINEALIARLRTIPVEIKPDEDIPF